LSRAVCAALRKPNRGARMGKIRYLEGEVRGDIVEKQPKNPRTGKEGEARNRSLKECGVD